MHGDWQKKSMKKLLDKDFIMDWWLNKYHGITCDWLRENEPELIKTSFWYQKYAVTQEQHDEWYNWAIDYMAKYYRRSKKRVERDFGFDYLNCSPATIIQKRSLITRLLQWLIKK